MSTLFQLFIAFVKIGFTSFGGMSAVPLILEQMELHGWMTAHDMSNLVGIAEMTPGPLGLNCATFAGQQTAGFAGGIAAVIGVLAPAYTLTIVAAIFYQKFRTSKIMIWIMKVVKPLCIALLLDVLLTLFLQDYFTPEHRIDIYSMIIGIVSFYLILKKKWTVPKVIINAALLGILFFAVIPLL